MTVVRKVFGTPVNQKKLIATILERINVLSKQSVPTWGSGVKE